MAKPTGASCNLSCKYCFYRTKKDLYPEANFRMSDEVLEAYISQYLESHPGPEVNFCWQGGEPTLMGLDFFQKAVDLQMKYCPPAKTVSNSFQTNGILLNDEWCHFFKDHNFLIGLSLDGPKELHDFYRIDKKNQPTFEKVIHTLDLLKKHKVEFNILCVLNRYNAEYPQEVYNFFKNKEVKFIQFIPAVGRTSNGEITDWTVLPEQYGNFLCTVFDTWVKQDVGHIFVQAFDVALGSWLDLPSSLCIHAETCGDALIIEHNGDIYSCDHFVFPEYRLGNIMKTPLNQLVSSQFQQKFGVDKRDTLPHFCRKCSVLFACRGGCPKDRFITTPDMERGLNYLCSGYKMFFTYVDPYMRIMAEELKAGRPAANIMKKEVIKNGKNTNRVTAFFGKR